MEPAGKNAEGANGRAKLTPLQQRVYEYSDAGMSIAEIANEIGIGKGEVRLILSIRKERS
jgi:DNA-binding NarL/FixJ family response regulator